MKEWKNFMDSGLLWFVNRQLHIFGWSILAETNEDGEVIRVLPTKTKFRGFGYKDEKEGFEKITKFMEKEIPKLKEDVKN